MDIKRYLITMLSLKRGEDDRQKTLESVAMYAVFKGSSIWILACAILVASVGLNVNSTAVIIGAMLISPLMGPIVAAGFALGIYDFDLLKKSAYNLLVAALVSIVVSFLYFLITPFKEAHSELLSRTSPNIYDIMIAFFGGIVGAISVTRIEKGNPIPGVAIATALMPPLCTAGYGLATGNFKFFFGAFFLFLINSVFICIATYAIVKYLKYPPKDLVNEKHQKFIRISIPTIVVLMILPGIYFAWKLFEQQRFNQIVNNFFEKEFTEKGYTIVYKKTNYDSKPRTIELAFLSKRLTRNQIDSATIKLNSYNIPTTKLLVRQDSADRMELLKNNILNEVNQHELELDEKDKKIQSLEEEAAKNTFDSKKILLEAKTIFPTLEELAISNNTFFYSNDSTSKSTIVIYSSKRDLNKTDKEKFKNWLTQRLSKGNIELIQR